MQINGLRLGLATSCSRLPKTLPEFLNTLIKSCSKKSQKLLKKLLKEANILFSLFFYLAGCKIMQSVQQKIPFLNIFVLRNEPLSRSAKLSLPITPIGIVAYAFTLLLNNLCRNSCILTLGSFRLEYEYEIEYEYEYPNKRSFQNSCSSCWF